MIRLARQNKGIGQNMFEGCIDEAQSSGWPGEKIQAQAQLTGINCGFAVIEFGESDCTAQECFNRSALFRMGYRI